MVSAQSPVSAALAARSPRALCRSFASEQRTALFLHRGLLPNCALGERFREGTTDAHRTSPVERISGLTAGQRRGIC